jgi:hypothetical protein
MASADAGVPGDGVRPGGAVPPDAAAAATSDPRRAHASDFVFDDTRLRHYEIAVSAADWQTLLRKPREYVPAGLKADGEDVGLVGLRLMGNTTLSRCVGGDGAIDTRKCPKLSYKIKIDQYEPSKRYYGLKKLSFPSMYGDPTLLRERLAYKLFRDMGVVAPRSVHATLSLNGEPRGLFALTEVVDGRFTDHAFPKGDGDGNLYKQVWPVSRDPTYYIKGNTFVSSGQRTNEGLVPPAKIVAFAAELAAAGEAEAALARVVGAWLDPGYTLRWLAVDEAIKNWDGPRYFQCDGAGRVCVNINYYLYESSRENKLWIIPYDPDLTFQKQTVRDEPAIPSWNEPVADCSRRLFVANVRYFQPPWCDRVFRGLAGLGKARYAEAVRALLDGPFVVKAMQASVDAWAASLAEAVRADPHGPKPEAWMAAVAAFKNDLPWYRQRVERILHQATSPPGM